MVPQQAGKLYFRAIAAMLSRPGCLAGRVQNFSSEYAHLSDPHGKKARTDAAPCFGLEHVHFVSMLALQLFESPSYILHLFAQFLDLGLCWSGGRLYWASEESGKKSKKNHRFMHELIPPGQSDF